MPANDIDIRVITAADVMPLRMAILRPNRPAAAAQFPDDEAATTCHMGAFRGGQLFGIASYYRAELKDRPGVAAIQLRGMATTPEVRGAGLGRALVIRGIEYARELGVELLWCNARTSAVGFYQKLGFVTIGDEFEYPDVGPHFRMWIRVAD